MDATGQNEPGAARPASFWISLALLAAVIFVYVLLMSNRGSSTTGTEGPAIGRQLAYLDLQPLTAADHAIALHDLRGHVTLINFWGTWCPPCIRELPQIVELAEAFADREAFRLYAVSCGQEGDAALEPLKIETEAFLEARGTTLPTYADQHAATRQALVLKLGTPMAYPTTLILDRNGVIRGYWQGYDARAAGQMEELIEQLLSEPAEQQNAAQLEIEAGEQFAQDPA